MRLGSPLLILRIYRDTCAKRKNNTPLIDTWSSLWNRPVKLIHRSHFLIKYNNRQVVLRAAMYIGVSLKINLTHERARAGGDP